MSALTADTLISEVLQNRRGAVDVFARFGLGCAHCLAAEMETLRSVADMHDVNLDDLLDALREAEADDSVEAGHTHSEE